MYSSRWRAYKRQPVRLYRVRFRNELQLYTWGSGYHGQLALGTRQVQATPSIVSKLLATQQLLTRVWCGSHHCAAVTADGELYTWGSNRTGCLGRILPGTTMMVQMQDSFSRIGCRGVCCCGVGWEGKSVAGVEPLLPCPLLSSPPFSSPHAPL